MTTEESLQPAREVSLAALASDVAAYGRAVGIGAKPGSVVAWADNVRPVMLAALARTRPRDTIVVIAATDTQSRALADDLTAFVDGEVLHFPAWETLPFERVSPGVETMGERMRVAARLRDAVAPRFIVTSIRAVLQRLSPAARTFTPFVVRRGEMLDVQHLTNTLSEWGYLREHLVEHRGEFANRGGIFDVFDSTADMPVRIELWGDDVERISAFAVNDQRSIRDLAEVTLYPARELLIDDQIVQRATALASSEPWGREQWERVVTRSGFDGMENWLAWLVDEETTLLDLLPETLADRAAVVLLDPAYTRSRAQELANEESAVAEALASTWSFNSHTSLPRLHVNVDELLARPDLPLALSVSAPLFGDSSDAPLVVESTRWGSPTSSPAQLAERLRDLFGLGYRIVLCHDNIESARRTMRDLASEGAAVRLVEETSAMSLLPNGDDPAIVIAVRQMHEGFVLPFAKLALATEAELTGRRSTRRRRTRRRQGSLMFEDLKAGDHVVHDVHGIGMFEGMARRMLDGVERDFLQIRYADGVLLVLSDQIDFVRQYVGGDAPSLNRMGGADFTRTKQRVRNELRIIAQELVLLYQRRLHTQGHAFSPDTPWQAEMEAAFPYIETPDQLEAIEAVKRDMESPHLMDRLVCGDVGFGKTEVALRAVFKCVQDGKQAAVLVPTTLLASQHMATFSERLKPFPIRVELLSRFVPDSQARRVVRALATGDVDVVIGTHSLLRDTIRYKNLGLLVVDEEQRFGVQHKESIKMRYGNVDVLTLSATPIPRTLEMSLVGIRDMSLLNTPPADRQPIRTHVTTYDDRVAAEAIRRELLRDGQVFWVHNRVETIEERAEQLRRLVPEARITYAHGQMDELVLEQTVIDFWEGRFDVLVCTTIIESGIDMPAVNTLVVEDAQRLGLGQLHQLRGRVGRAGQQAYAFLFYPRGVALSEIAYERLKTIGETTDLGSGYKIARRDLELRGAGSLLGEQQSGRIMAVGYDLYCQMVNEAVVEMRGEIPDSPLDLKIEMKADAYLPHDYVDSEELRLDAYRKLALVVDDDSLDDLRREWIDRYGALPPPAEALLRIGLLRTLCHRLGLRRVTVQDGSVRLSPLRLSPRDVEQARAWSTRTSYDDDAKTLRLEVPRHEASVDYLLRLLPEFLYVLPDFVHTLPSVTRASPTNHFEN
ncbi:MAG: transcription-repair coupling factor [Actinomycetota bacterium]